MRPLHHRESDMNPTTEITEVDQNPLSPDMDEWEEFLEGRYKKGKSQEEFRQYDAEANPEVAEFYRLNHASQTHAYVLTKENQYFGLKRGEKSIWEAAEFLNTLVDDSDPDTDLTQLEHLLQTSEAIRKDGHPRWMVELDLFMILASVFASTANRSGAW
jgi:inositol oxygenase